MERATRQMERPTRKTIRQNGKGRNERGTDVNYKEDGLLEEASRSFDASFDAKDNQVRQLHNYKRSSSKPEPMGNITRYRVAKVLGNETKDISKRNEHFS